VTDGPSSPVDGLDVHDRPVPLATDVLYAILKLRVDVFVVEQACPYPELDGRDLEPTTRHIWLAPPGHPDRPACYLRVLAEPDGMRRIGRVVTAPGQRGRSLAGHLLRWVLHVHPGPSVLDAQAHLQHWYERAGFDVAGPTFLEDGIPHVPMRRDG
jgi:ElaA protein